MSLERFPSVCHTKRTDHYFSIGESVITSDAYKTNIPPLQLPYVKISSTCKDRMERKTTPALRNIISFLVETHVGSFT